MDFRGVENEEKDTKERNAKARRLPSGRDCGGLPNPEIEEEKTREDNLHFHKIVNYGEKSLSGAKCQDGMGGEERGGEAFTRIKTKS